VDPSGRRLIITILLVWAGIAFSDVGYSGIASADTALADTVFAGRDPADVRMVLPDSASAPVDTQALDLPSLEVKARRRPGSGIQEGLSLGRDYFVDNRRTTVAAALDKQPGLAT
jgi:hypothetical protein